MIGFILGAVAIAVINEILPHEHIFKGFEGWQSARSKIKAAWLVAVAIVIHNLPEGNPANGNTVSGETPPRRA